MRRFFISNTYSWLTFVQFYDMLFLLLQKVPQPKSEVKKVHVCWVTREDGSDRYGLFRSDRVYGGVELIDAGATITELAERIDLDYWQPGYDMPHERMQIFLDVEEQIIWERGTGKAILIRRISPVNYRMLLEEVAKARTRREAANRQLDEMHEQGLLSARTLNCLHNARIYSRAELAEQTRSWLLGIKHFGRISLLEVETALAKYGLKLKSEE